MKWILPVWIISLFTSLAGVNGNESSSTFRCGTCLDVGRHGLSAAAFTSPGWTVGSKRVLVMRLDFSDVPSQTLSEERCEQMMTFVDRIYWTNSYGRLSFTWTITPALRLPGISEDYTTFAHLLNEAWTAATAAGFRREDYDLEIMVGKANLGSGT